MPEEPKELIKVTGETKKGLSTGFTPDNHLNAINLIMILYLNLHIR